MVIAPVKLLRRKLRENRYIYYPLSALRRHIRRLRRVDYRKGLSKLLNDMDKAPYANTIKMPGIAVVGITNVCNLDCLMCQTNASARAKGYMDPATFDLLLKQLGHIGIDTLGISIQGETFVHKGLEKLLEIARRRHFTVWLGTNGQFPEKIESAYRHFPAVISYCRFSIDGATKKTYEHIRRGGSFEKILESLEVVHRINKARRDSRLKLYIEVVLNMENMFELNRFFTVFGKYCFEENIHFNIIDSVAPDTAYFWNTFPFKNLITRRLPCNRPFEMLNFTYSGKMTLCCQDYTDELVVGDIHEASISDIWKGEKAELIRKKHLTQDAMDIEICRKCFRPYGFVHSLANRYIHFLHDCYPKMDSKEFGEKVLAFLKGMDETKGKGDAQSLKRFVFGAFDK